MTSHLLPPGATHLAPPGSDLAQRVAHRPWPLPPGPWLVAQTWSAVLFAHWPLAPAAVQPHLPPPLAAALDTFAGQAWVGLVPFRVARLGLRGTPAPCRLAFPELNLRTYVRVGGKAGVWFFRLDAAHPLAVLLGRALLHLPYHWAPLRLEDADGWVRIAGRRGVRGEPFAGRYQPTGPVVPAPPGSLAHWLTERYCLYAVDGAGRLRRLEIHHDPWPLQPARADLAPALIAAQSGLVLPGPPPLLHVAHRLDVLAWPPVRVAPVAGAPHAGDAGGDGTG